MLLAGSLTSLLVFAVLTLLLQAVGFRLTGLCRRAVGFLYKGPYGLMGFHGFRMFRVRGFRVQGFGVLEFDGLGSKFKSREPKTV